MAKIMLRKTDKKCALCKYWNGAVGSNTIQYHIKFELPDTELRKKL